MKATALPQPIFVVGSSRSGTTLMASILQASPDVATYRAESLLVHSCEPKYGKLDNKRSKQRFLADWLNSRQFRRSGLDPEVGRRIVYSETTYIGVLAAYMGKVAQQQGKKYWVDSTPTNGYRLAELSSHFPDARFIHMIRDGRAVALSLSKVGWSGSNSRKREVVLQYAALKWVDSVKSASQQGVALGQRYLEVKYEDLVDKTEHQLERVFEHLPVAIPDVEAILSGSGAQSADKRSSLAAANTPFGDVTNGISSAPAHRWKRIMSPEHIRAVEVVAGERLKHCGYALLIDGSSTPLMRLRGIFRRLRIDGRHWMKFHTPLGRLSQTPLEVGLE